MSKKATTAILTEGGRTIKDRGLRPGAAALMALFFIAIIMCCAEYMVYREVVAVGLISGIALILLLQLFYNRGMAETILRIVLTFIFLVTAFFFISDISTGVLLTANRLILYINLRFGTDFLSFRTGETSFMTLVLLWGTFAWPLAAMVIFAVNRGFRLLLAAVAGVMIFAAFVLGRNPSPFSAAAMGVAIVYMFVYFESPGRHIGWAGAALALIGLLLAAFSMKVTESVGVSDTIDEFKRTVISRVDELRYGSDNLPEGDLSRANGLLKGDDPALELTMQHPQEMYLRGFVGADYKSQAAVWDELDVNAYQGEYRGLLEWLEENDFYPAEQYSEFYSLYTDSRHEHETNGEVSVNNVGAYSKYLYMPFSASDWNCGSAGYRRDWQVRSKGLFGSRKYDFTVSSDIASADAVTFDGWGDAADREAIDGYLGAESVYNAFVNEYYTDINDDLKPLIMETFGTRDELKALDFPQLVSRIRRILREQAAYTENPGQLPEGEDFITWFLEDSEQGNAVHFASAAVMAFRQAGYPARYTEGYHLSAEDAAAVSTDGTVTLTGKNAHAWVEIYMQGIGWAPIEVVPGMYVETYTSQTIEGSPTYRVNSFENDEGIDADMVENGAGMQGEDVQEEEKPYWFIVYIIIALYALLAVYLILELERFVRRKVRAGRFNAADESGRADSVRDELTKVIKLAKVEGNTEHLDELAAAVVAVLPDVRSQDYSRTVSLLQKVRYGGVGLLSHEREAVRHFMDGAVNSLYSESGIIGWFKLRYIDAL